MKTIKRLWLRLEEYFYSPRISVKNIKDSNISIKINGEEKIK